MEKLFVIIVDDQREVLTTISKDLSELSAKVSIEECESSGEALELLEEIDSNGDFPAVVISDHVMPGKTGVEFLSDISSDSRFSKVKKVLLTGLASHQDTINAINQANIQSYIEKPWDKANLVKTVKELITLYILDVGADYENFSEVIDNDTLLANLRG